MAAPVEQAESKTQKYTDPDSSGGAVEPSAWSAAAVLAEVRCSVPIHWA